MFSFLTDFNILAIGVAVAYVVGVLTATKVTDFIKGVPGEARVAIKNVETDALAKLATARADVLAKLPGAPVPAKVALPAVATLPSQQPPAPLVPAAAPAAPAA